MDATQLAAAAAPEPTPTAAAADGTTSFPVVESTLTTEKPSEPVTQKVIRCKRLRAEVPQPSARYDGNTPKEELLLEHVREFEEQFVNVYGNRFLFLCPPNEYDVPKFLPTTIRPTHLPYKELYEHQSCAQFLADFFSYDELSPPDRYPSKIPAPASVLKWQAGDCFDISVAMVSLLIGVGYDAYCVSGFAPRFITTRNEARSACPHLEFEAEEPEEEQQDDEEEFTIPKRPLLKSEVQEQYARAREADEQHKKEEAAKSDSEDDPSSEEDEYENRRVHCWVLVRRGQREVPEDIYIEPTTGRMYAVERCPYLKIDLIWNNKNLWINMQVCNAAQVQLDLYNSRCFEFVMLDPDIVAGQNGQNGEDAGVGVAPEDAEASRAYQAAQLLDMPPPWSERPDIPREKFHERCYMGEKTIFYHKCKVEQYAPYTQDDGLVQRITLYKDVRRLIPLEIRERFRHRRDKLSERKRRPMQNETIEKFAPGRPPASTSQAGALKQLREFLGVSKELIFYNSRLDGLVRSFELIGKKNFEYFEDRDDRLVYHSVTLDQPGGDGRNGRSKEMLQLDSVHNVELPIRKMTEKYARNPEVPADEDPQKICYFLAEGKIRVDYHREPGVLTYRSETYFSRDGGLERHPPKSPPPTAQEVQKLLQMQVACRDRLAEAQQGRNQELILRKKEEQQIRTSRSNQQTKSRSVALPSSGKENDEVLEPSVYDLARRDAARAGAHRKDGAEEDKPEEQASKVDILAPYLVDFVDKETGYAQLDAVQAELVTKKCTQDFRKRLTDRAEIIQRRLEEEQDQLRKRRAQMQRRGDNVEKDDREFDNYRSLAMFRTQILEQRLARHEMQAIEKFQELERMLQDDPRLAAMWKKDPPPQKPAAAKK